MKRFTEFEQLQNLLNAHSQEISLLHARLSTGLTQLRSVEGQLDRKMSDRDLMTVIQEMKRELKELLHFCTVSKEKVEKDINKFPKEFESLRNEVDLCKKRLDVLEKARERDIADFLKLIHRLDDDYSNFRKIIIKETEEKVKNLSDKIIFTPDDAAKLVESLKEKVKVAQVEKDGLLKELRLLKRELLVTEKHVEHLYILIERMKGEKCPSRE